MSICKHNYGMYNVTCDIMKSYLAHVSDKKFLMAISHGKQEMFCDKSKDPPTLFIQHGGFLDCVGLTNYSYYSEAPYDSSMNSFD